MVDFDGFGEIPGPVSQLNIEVIIDHLDQMNCFFIYFFILNRNTTLTLNLLHLRHTVWPTLHHYTRYYTRNHTRKAF